MTLSTPLWTAARARVRLLLVDDDPSIQAALAALLDDAGFTIVATARDGVEGLALATALRPDVAVVDYRMPGMNGIELAGRIRASSAATRVVMLSAYDDDGIKAAAGDLVHAYLVKGWASETILETIDRVAAAAS
jgi:DNA-binding NarL/FixJ family response regulator